MNETFTLIIMALGLSMDAFAAALCNGLSLQNIQLRQHVFIASVFGIMQGLLPIAGYFLGSLFMGYLDDYRKWLSFSLLFVIGAKMLYEGVTSLRHQCLHEIKVFHTGNILLQGFATSIDALAVGISLISFSISIWVSAAVITAVTALICFFGVWLGIRFGRLIKNKHGIADILGGVILISIGISFLF